MKSFAAALILVGACALLAIIYEPAPAPRGAAGRPAVALAVAWSGTGIDCKAAAEGCTQAGMGGARER
jgi:hypothetical protein